MEAGSEGNGTGSGGSSERGGYLIPVSLSHSESRKSRPPAMAGMESRPMLERITAVMASTMRRNSESKGRMVASLAAFLLFNSYEGLMRAL